MPNAHPLQPRLIRQTRTASQLKALKKERAAWLAKLDACGHFHRIFDYILCFALELPTSISQQ
jgi:hypothetical protein